MAADNEAVTSGQDAGRIAREVRTKNEDLEFDVEKLFLITKVLWEVLQRHHGYTDEQLECMIEEIDSRDGRVDGKLGKAEVRPKCNACGRAIMKRQMKCLYCGEAARRNSFDR